MNNQQRLCMKIFFGLFALLLTSSIKPMDSCHLIKNAAHKHILFINGHYTNLLESVQAKILLKQILEFVQQRKLQQTVKFVLTADFPRAFTDLLGQGPASISIVQVKDDMSAKRILGIAQDIDLLVGAQSAPASVLDDSPKKRKHDSAFVEITHDEFFKAIMLLKQGLSELKDSYAGPLLGLYTEFLKTFDEREKSMCDAFQVADKKMSMQKLISTAQVSAELLNSFSKNLKALVYGTLHFGYLNLIEQELAENSIVVVITESDGLRQLFEKCLGYELVEASDLVKDKMVANYTKHMLELLNKFLQSHERVSVPTG